MNVFLIMNKNKIVRVLAGFIIINQLLGSHVAFGSNGLSTQLRLDEIANQTLNNALATQIKSPNKHYVEGEFPTLIQSTLLPVMAGVGKLIGEDQEASGFTTASVINVLAQTYLENQNEVDKYNSLQQIPQSIKKGVESFKRYTVGPTFNFYPPHNDNGQIVRRPIDMKLLPFWFGFTHIPNDADSSSVILSALVYDSKINGHKFNVSPDSIAEFSRYRDIDRKPMFYNKGQNRQNTGAFMTWLYDEKNPKMPRFYFADAKKGERIPFNVNDVDCIVNANVLKMSSLSQNQNMPGYKESCSMINDMIKKNEHAYCGIYYPNTYNLSFAMANAEKAGDRCLTDESKSLIIDKIINLQDGYTGAWSNDKNVWEDKTLSTAFAMYSLLHFGNPYEYRVYASLLYGMHFLLSQIEYNKGPIMWPSDNFFTATAIARSLIMWRSDAYTNAIISSVLFKMHKLYPQFTAENYLRLKFDNQDSKNVEFSLKENNGG